MTSTVEQPTDTTRNLNMLLKIPGRKIVDVNDGTAAKPQNLKIGVRFVPSERAKKQTSKSITVNDIHVNDVRSLMLMLLCS